LLGILGGVRVAGTDLVAHLAYASSGANESVNHTRRLVACAKRGLRVSRGNTEHVCIFAAPTGFAELREAIESADIRIQAII